MDYRPIVRERAQALGVDPNLAEALLVQESGGNPNAVSPKGASGLMQLMPGTARELGVDPNVPEQNIDGGLRYLKQQIDKFGVAGGLAAYNAGPGRLQRTGMQFDALPSETRNYVPSVMNRAALIAERSGAQPQPTQQRSTPMDIPTLTSGYQKAAAANDTEAVAEIGGLLQQRYQAALSKAQAANDTEAVAEIQGAMQQFGAPAAPRATTQAAPLAAPQVAPQPAKAPTPEKKAAEPRSVLRRVDDFVRGVADTATFGYADEIAGKLDSLFGGGQSGKKTFDEAVKAQRQRDSEGGGARLAGQFAGAVAPTIGVVRAVDGATRKARAGAGALTGAIQGGLYGTGSAEGGVENRLKEGATGAGIGAAVGGVGGLALSALVPTTVRQEANRFVRRAGSDDLAKIDAEVVRDLNDVFQREVRTQGGKQRPSMAIDANAVATRYINEAKDALGKLDPKTVPNLDEIAFEIANKGSTPSRILDQISQTPAGKAVVDAMLKADRVRTLTGQQLSAGGALGAAARIGVEASPAIISATTGVPAYLPRAGMDSITNKLGASVPRAKVIDKLLSPKQVKAAETVAGDLGASGPTQSLAVLKRMADEARQAQASKAVTTSAPSALSQLQETTAARRALGLVGSPRSGAYNTVLENTGLTNEQAIPILRKLSKDLKGTDLGEAATRLRRSQDVPNEGAFYDVQNILRDLQGSPGALSAASSGIRNPVSYKANVEAAQQALKNAAEAAPTKELAQFATKVAGIKAPADKAKAIADRMAKSSDPAEQAFLTQFVEPLTQFGKK